MSPVWRPVNAYETCTNLKTLHVTIAPAFNMETPETVLAFINAEWDNEEESCFIMAASSAQWGRSYFSEISFFLKSRRKKTLEQERRWVVFSSSHLKRRLKAEPDTSCVTCCTTSTTCSLSSYCACQGGGYVKKQNKRVLNGWGAMALDVACRLECNTGGDTVTQGGGPTTTWSVCTCWPEAVTTGASVWSCTAVTVPCACRQGRRASSLWQDTQIYPSVDVVVKAVCGGGGGGYWVGWGGILCGHVQLNPPMPCSSCTAQSTTHITVVQHSVRQSSLPPPLSLHSIAYLLLDLSIGGLHDYLLPSGGGGSGVLLHCYVSPNLKKHNNKHGGTTTHGGLGLCHPASATSALVSRIDMCYPVHPGLFFF